jgi:hypothetical protein
MSAITDSIPTTGSDLLDKILSYGKDLVTAATDNIKVNVNNPVIDFSNSPYIKYLVIGVSVVIIYFLFFNKKTAIT